MCHAYRLQERVQELEASEARVRELEADALLRTMDQPLDADGSFSSTSSREPYEHFDRDWVRPSCCLLRLFLLMGSTIAFAAHILSA